MAAKKPSKTAKKAVKSTAAKASKIIVPLRKIMWVNHFDLLPGDPTVLTSFNAVSSGVGGGLTGLVIQSTTTGQSTQNGAIKSCTWLWTFLRVI